MSTIDSAETVRHVLENDGNYDGDPQLFEIWCYENPFGGWSIKFYWEPGDWRRHLRAEGLAGGLVWSRDKGVTIGTGDAVLRHLREGGGLPMTEPPGVEEIDESVRAD